MFTACASFFSHSNIVLHSHARDFYKNTCILSHVRTAMLVLTNIGQSLKCARLGQFISLKNSMKCLYESILKTDSTHSRYDRPGPLHYPQAYLRVICRVLGFQPHRVQILFLYSVCQDDTL